ncbi:hypothetical protein ACWENO_14035 [Streptomyces sp. NPDC004436]
MLTKWWEQYGRQTAQGRASVRTAIAGALDNGLEPNVLWQALVRLGDLSKPITGGTLQFALAELRKAATGSNVVHLPNGQAVTGTDAKVAGWAALAAKLAAEDSEDSA